LAAGWQIFIVSLFCCVVASGLPGSPVRAMEEILAVWLPHESGERGNREALEPIKDISRDRRRSK
jgi:hypothetical protein